MALRLRCSRCGKEGFSALFYRGRGKHLCKSCGGRLALADPADERRSGHDRRDARVAPRTPDLRAGADRREAPFA